MAAIAELEGVISAARSPDAEISHVAKMVESVPGLGDAVRQYARIFYAREKQDWVDGSRTLLLLGPRVLAEVATQQSIVRAVKELKLPAVVEEVLWLDTLRQAVAARLFAKHFPEPVNEDHAFTAAMCVEIGVASMLRRVGCYSAWFTRVRPLGGFPRMEVARTLFGCRISEGFETLSQGLGLGPELRKEVFEHGVEESGAMSSVLVYAARYAHAMGSSNAAEMLDEFTDDVSVELFCATEEVWELIKRIEDQVTEVAAAMGVEAAWAAPVEMLEERSGDFDASVFAPEEAANWTRILEAQIMSLEHESGVMAERLEQLHGRDALTGLVSHSVFLGSLEREVAASRASGRHCCLILVDVDQFTQINRFHGFDVGDQVLVGVVTILKKMHGDARAMARVGPDSFVLLLDIDDWRARVVGERLRAAIEGMRLENHNHRLRVTATIAGAGLSSIEQDEDHAGLMAAVHTLMNKFRRQGNLAVWAG